jgi:alkylation response protein AidB-like acyl-CoA dehydrogenase
MNQITFTEEQQSVQAAAKDFAEKELLPGVIDRDNQQIFPTDQIAKLGQLGFLGMMVHPKYGGSGLDAVSYVLALQEICKVEASVGTIMSVCNSLVCYGLEHFGAEMQKEKYLIPLAKGTAIGAFCLSEPEAGSDATAQKTTAVDCGDYYLLNGTKNWISNGQSATYYLVMAQSNPSKKHKGINAFILEKGMPGFVVGKKEDKMGIRSSDTHSLMFQDVRVPKENRIGDEGFGFTFAMKTLDGGRLGIAAQAVGIATGAIERAIAYTKERSSFNKKISEHQGIQFKLAEMATKVETAQLITLKAAQLKDANEDYAQASAMAKLYASEVAMSVSTDAVQIHGGYGYVKEFHVERLMRDAKITEIYEGTSEIQKIIIARNLLK